MRQILLTPQTQAALDAQEPLASPTSIGNATGIRKAMVNLANVDDTAEAAKPVSTATQAALAPLASPAFTGTVTGISKAMVKLANVDNTADAAKPVRTATQAAIDLKASIAGLSTKTDKSTTENSAVAWSAGLVNDAKHYLTTNTNSVVSRSKTDGFEAMKVMSTGIVTFSSSVVFDAEPPDITFASSSSSPYTLQFAFDSKQDSLTGATATGAPQLLLGTTYEYLEAGANITLSADGTSVTGPSIATNQDVLTAATASGAHPTLFGTTIKCLMVGANVSSVSDGTSVTLSPDLTSKQNTLTAAPTRARFQF
jgi:hypothetical protein